MRIVELLRSEPGASTSMVAARLALDQSTADYHLRRLKRGGDVVVERSGRELAWYVKGGGFCPLLRAALPGLRRESVAKVALVLDERPRTAGDVATRAGVSVGEARWACAVLETLGFVSRTASGRVMLREGHRMCVVKGAAQEPCTLWGSCEPSRQRGRDEAPLRVGLVASGTRLRSPDNGIYRAKASK